MYLEAFNLGLPPFAPEPDSRFIVLAPTHREALAALVYALDQREGWALLYSAPGLGKTTLLKALMMELDQTTVAGVVAQPSPVILDLYNQIALALGMGGPYNNKVNFFIALRGLIKQARLQGKTLLVVIDNAHALTAEQLLELRLLATADREEPRVFNLFLSSRPVIKNLLEQSEGQDLSQLLHRQKRLAPLDKRETAGYLKHRLRVAGGDPDIFPQETIDVIHAATQGVPRLINALCSQCLQEAERRGQARVSPRLANQALQDLGSLADILDPAPAPPLLPQRHHLYQGMGTDWNPCVDAPPRPELDEREQHLENHLLNHCHPAYGGMAWWDKTTQFTVEWDNLRRRRLGLLGPTFASFCPRWVDERWGALNLARRDADSVRALYTDWIEAQYKRVMGDHLGELPLDELHGQTARDSYRGSLDQQGHKVAQPVQAPYETQDFDPENPEHARHAANALEEIFDLASYVCAQEKRGAEDLVAEAVCQAVLPIKALNDIPELYEQVSHSLRHMTSKDRPAPDPPPKNGRPAIII
ncbi:MAG: AAA family ATPase [Deltaproteobacteria bacterium]|nr:AAA family ATPase [Deltaproteobacteria bacterium]